MKDATKHQASPERPSPRVAILAELPPNALPGLDAKHPSGSHASWFPQMVESFAGEKDFDIHWIALSNLVCQYTVLESHGQSIHVVPRRSKLLGLLTGYRWERARIGKVLKSLDPDVVNAWGTEDAYGLAACDSSYPTVISMLGLIQHYARVTNVGWFYRIQASYEKAILAKTRFLTAESDWAVKIMRDFAPHAVVSRAECAADSKYFEISWNPHPANPQAIFVGTIDQRKGIADAIAAFASPALQSYQLHVCGTGPLEKSLRAVSTPNIVWHGPVTKNDLLRILPEAWCLILPTRADNSPNVVKEARVIGMPVVTTPHGGQSDHIIHEKNGYLVEPDDIAALTASVERILSNFALCRSLGAFKHAEQREQLRPETAAKKLLDLYREINLAAHRPPGETTQ